MLFNCGFYNRINEKALWILGILGLLFNVYVTLNHVEHGDVLGKTLVGLTFFQYAPLLFLFPNLIEEYKSHKV